MDKQSEMGPLVTKEHLAKVKSYVDMENEGAKLVVDGRILKYKDLKMDIIWADVYLIM